MIDKKEFTAIGKELYEFDGKREEVIAKSRNIIRLSKQVIYAVHREDLTGAEKLVRSIKAAVKVLPSGAYETGMHKVALQEYVEAMTFFNFVKTGKLATKKELDVDTDSYLLGLCDFSGELVRFSVNSVIRGNPDRVYEARKVVLELYGEFLKFNLRNSELRKKVDSVKWNLKSIEDVVYDLEIKCKK